MCNVQTAVTVFDLLDYYESCERLNISYNKNLGIRGWQACARFIKKVCIVITVLAVLQYWVPVSSHKYCRTKVNMNTSASKYCSNVTYGPTEIYENNVS